MNINNLTLTVTLKLTLILLTLTIKQKIHCYAFSMCSVHGPFSAYTISARDVNNSHKTWDLKNFFWSQDMLASIIHIPPFSSYVSLLSGVTSIK